MNYRVHVTPNARIEMYGAAQWWAENRDPDQAARWLAGIEVAIGALAIDPERHPLADEDEDFPFALRQILYGLSRRKTHRAVFEVRENEVIVHAIRHLAQRNLEPDDL